MINLKKVVITILIILFIIIIGLVICYYTSSTKITVLTYHDFINEKPQNNMQISEENFKKQMKYLHDHKYKTLKLKDIECFIEGKCELPKKSVLITMDDGWKNELLIAAPILKKYNLNATIFYIGEHYDGTNENFMNKDDIEKLKKEYPNIELANHSYKLHYEEAYLLDEKSISSDLNKMNEINESKYYAYPYGKYSVDYMKSLNKLGYSLAFTFGPNDNHRKLTKEDNKYELPRLNMSTDMPMWKFILRLNWYK